MDNSPDRSLRYAIRLADILSGISSAENTEIITVVKAIRALPPRGFLVVARYFAGFYITAGAAYTANRSLRALQTPWGIATLSVAITGALADTDTTATAANDVAVNIFWG